jgi:spermidine/putrescine transport system permease protein
VTVSKAGEQRERPAAVARPTGRVDRVFLWTVLPGLLYLVVFFLLPLGIVAVYSLFRATVGGGMQPALTLSNYARVADPVYLTVLAKSVGLALVTTVLSLAIAYPAAWAIRGMKRSRQALFLALFVLPSWMNLLIKNYAWIVILRRQGILNTLFQSLGLISEPLPLLFNTGAVLVGLVHTYLPFMLLPIYVAIERMDFRLVEAARDLSAGPWQVFRRVVLPSTRAGAVVGCTLVFVPALGAFVTPDLLGGPQSLMVGTLIENQLLQVRDWPFAAALSVSLMAVVAIALAVSRRLAPGEGAATW